MQAGSGASKPAEGWSFWEFDYPVNAERLKIIYYMSRISSTNGTFRIRINVRKRGIFLKR